jgi:hypothetical protein
MYKLSKWSTRLYQVCAPCDKNEVLYNIRMLNNKLDLYDEKTICGS